MPVATHLVAGYVLDPLETKIERMEALGEEMAAAVNGLDRTTALEVNDVPSLLELVAHGLGVALVPEVVTRYPAQVRYLRLRAPTPLFEVAVATVGDPPASQAARVLLGMLGPSSPA